MNETAGTLLDGHYITKLSDGNDPVINTAQLPMVAPGSTNSLRIGNRTSGARFDRIRTSLFITPDNAIFQYRFAIVLQDPNHLPFQQPAFRIRVLTDKGSEIGCGYYEVSAARQISGFKEQGSLRYRNWTTGAINLRAFVGQVLTIEVTTNDCTEGGHYGYAYFDAQCIKPEVTVQTKCPGSQDSLVISAPAGFEAYQWSNGAISPSITIFPKEGDQYSVRIRPFSSLNTDCDFSLTYTVPALRKPTVLSASICAGEGFVIGDTTFRTSGTFTRRLKRAGEVCDSVVVTTLTVRPLVQSTQSVTLCAGESLTINKSVYTKAGTYIDTIPRNAPLCDSVVTTILSIRPLVTRAQSVTICAGDSYNIANSLYQQAGIYTDRFARPLPLCDSIVTTTLSVIDPIVTITGGRLYQAGDSLQLQVAIVPPGLYQYQWTPSDQLSCASCPAPWASPSETTVYKLTISTDGQGCQRSGEATVVVEACNLYLPDAFTPDGDGINDVFKPVGGDCVAEVKTMVVYNRWGEKIHLQTNFSIKDPDAGWDGTYLGKPVLSGQYPFRIDYIRRNGRSSSLSGMVTLVR
ncbi:T9SS type B sorting domain-containing protein [Spirosoma sordidisoli]|nr:T9SS type B sorting domain-containing protein [Spirosoma sordidisoli]